MVAATQRSVQNTGVVVVMLVATRGEVSIVQGLVG